MGEKLCLWDLIVCQNLLFWFVACCKENDFCRQQHFLSRERGGSLSSLEKLRPFYSYNNYGISADRTVCTNCTLEARTLFGPMVGLLGDIPSESPFKYALKHPGGELRFYQLHSDESCNWMKFVRFAENADEQNVVAYLQEERVYFATVRPISAGEELKVWYGRKYGMSIGKPQLVRQAEVTAQNEGLSLCL